MTLLQFRVEASDGHTIDVHGGDGPLKWRPLGMKEFRDSVVARLPFTMAIDGASTSVSGPVHVFSSEGDVSFRWTPGFSVKVFGLVPGGWLPAAVCESTLLLPDANLAGRFSMLDDEASRVRAMSGLPDVPLLALGTNLVSPLLAAFEEGGRRRLPTRAEFDQSIRAIAARLRRGFPGLKVVFPTSDMISAGFAIIQDLMPAHKRNVEFLRHVYPLIAHRIDDALLKRRHADIDLLGERFSVPKGSFLHFLVIDCLYDDGPRPKLEQRPGRLVLKPKKVFNDGDLFNALVDVVHMDMLCMAHVAREGEFPVLCTMDCGLALAWSMLRPSNMRREEGNQTFTIRPDDSFALRMPSQERLEFFEAMGRRS